MQTSSGNADLEKYDKLLATEQEVRAVNSEMNFN